LHVDPVEQVDLVVIDLGWTPQRLAIPAAMRWLNDRGRIITLIKPHYELDEKQRRELLRDGVLNEDDAASVAARVAGELPSLGVRVVGLTASPIEGSKGKGRGNREWLALLERPQPGVP